YDDYLFAGHTGHSAVLVTLALAEKYGISGKEFLAAQTVANEVGGRLGASVLFGPHNGQMWSFVHLIGAALVTSRVMGLEASQMRSAIGLAMSQPNYPLRPAFFGSEAKVLLAATTAQIGVQAAQLAASGLRGRDDVIEHEHGFASKFADDPLMG